MLTKIYMTYYGKSKDPLKNIVFRQYDRGMNLDSKKNDEAENNDKVNTRKKFQEEVDSLYTGTEINSEAVYSDNYVFFWSIVFFSTGCPLLYPIAAAFFALNYWYQKSLSLHYYRRSSKFSHNLPMAST